MLNKIKERTEFANYIERLINETNNAIKIQNSRELDQTSLFLDINSEHLINRVLKARELVEVSKG